jgi:acetyl-CoA/propionyl-CoA carboxylase carboxyl transferase subunit
MSLSETAKTITLEDAVDDHRDPVARLANLLDDGSIQLTNANDTVGVQAAVGQINGARVFAFCTDATVKGGALSATGSDRIVATIDAALRDRCPVIGLWHSGGARLADGVESMDGVGRIFAAITRASGRIPQVSVVLGPAAGAAAYGPALTDIIIMSATGRVFVTGPDVVRSVTGEQIDMEGLGGPRPHSRKSGVVHIVASSEDDAYLRARRIIGFFTRPGLFDLSLVDADRELLGIMMPESSRRAYDVRPLLREIVDTTTDNTTTFEELQPHWAANMVVGLGRLAGHTVGVLANNPVRKGGCLDSLSAEKASRFVRMCDALAIPLAVFVDVPGYLPGVGQEWGGVVRRGAKLLHAFAEAVVPRVTVITRKSYGGAYIAMNSRALGATTVLAWPQAEVAVMSAEAAVGILHRKELAAAPPSEAEILRTRLVKEHEQVAGGVSRAMALGVVDRIIDPARTPYEVALALATAPGGCGHHGNIPL